MTGRIGLCFFKRESAISARDWQGTETQATVRLLAFRKSWLRGSASRLTDERGAAAVKRDLSSEVCKMEREHFVKLVAEVLDALPEEFRKRIHNLAVLVEDEPPRRFRRKPRGTSGNAGPRKTRSLVLGVFQGQPATTRSVFDLSIGPNRIILYRKNIEAVCSNEAEIRHEVRQTVLHELGHYFGMDEAQLKDV